MDVLARNLSCIKRTKLKPTDLDFFDIFNENKQKVKKEGKDQESIQLSTTFSNKAFSQNDS